MEGELSAGRWSALTVFTAAVLGSWVLSARQSGWIDVGLLGLLPDAILLPLMALVLKKCGFGQRAAMVTALVMVVGFLSFWILCVIYSVTGTWWAALPAALAGSAILFELTKRYLRNREQSQASDLTRRSEADAPVAARRSKHKSRSA
jgi:hypothetical protein